MTLTRNISKLNVLIRMLMKNIRQRQKAKKEKRERERERETDQLIFA